MKNECSVLEKKFYLFMLLGLFIYSTFTFFNNFYNFYISTFISAFFVFITCLRGLKWNFNIKYIVFFIFTLISFFLFFLNDLPTRWSTYVSGTMHIFFWSSSFNFISLNYDKKTLKKFSVVMLLSIFVSMVATLRALNLYPYAARALYGKADGIDDSSFLFSMGCGGFGFIYGLVFLSMSLLTCVKAKIKWTTKIWLFLFLIFTYYLIIRGEFATGMILTLLIIFIMLFYSEKHPGFFIAVFLLASILILFNINAILTWIVQLANSFNIEILNEKVLIIEKLISTGDSESSLRLTLYLKSINSFLENPIFGSNVAGMHSQILDTLAYCGVFGFSYIYFLYLTIKNFHANIGKKNCLVLGISIFFLAFVNPFVDMTLTAFAFFASPCIIFTFSSENEKITNRKYAYKNISNKLCY